LRPYIAVTAIPNFDPTKLPYWETYVREKKDKSIIVGGTIAGQFMAGLSGGQRKLLLFELIFQRTANQDSLLIVLDEPFAGVTDDFIPFIVKRLNEMRKKHNILLVTNDHVDTLKSMADNSITVSAIDRSKVKINEREGVDRELALLAMSIGDEYKHTTNNEDLAFFRRVEFSKNGGILNVMAFAVFAFGLFLLMFWNSSPGSEALVLVAAGMVSYFTLNPYFLQLVDWRVYMIEEAEALLHSSKSMNKFLKSCLTLALVVVVTSVQFGCQDATIGTMTSAEFYFGILFENISSLVALICFGLYSDLPDQAVQIFGAMPFLFMIFFSTTFSPGAGVEGVKALRYLFPRFYLWCMIPLDLGMEGCPEENTLLYLFLSSLLVPFLFISTKLVRGMYTKFHTEKAKSNRQTMMKTVEFAELQFDLYGEKVLKRLQHLSTHDLMRLTTKMSESDRSLMTKEVDNYSYDDEDAEEADGFDGFMSYLNGPSKKDVVSGGEV